MDRSEKIDEILEFLDENRVVIIDTKYIGSVIIDATLTIDKEDDKYEYDELIEKGFTDDDIEDFKRFLDENTLMMIKIDEISGVSFENAEYYIDGLIDTDLWKD